MPFFKNVGKSLKTSGKALNSFGQILNGAMEELEEISHQGVLKTNVRKLERNIATLEGHPENDSELQEKRHELIDSYERVISAVPEPEKTSFREKKEKLIEKSEIRTIQNLKNLINQNQIISFEKSFDLAIEKIKHLEKIQKNAKTMRDLAEKNSLSSDASHASKILSSTSAEIERLQKLRYTQDVTYYSSGNLYKKIHKYDGKPHGVLEQWHENSQKMAETNFCMNRVDGISRYWDAQGIMLSKITIHQKPTNRPEKIEQHNYYANGNTHSKIIIQNNIQTISIFEENGAHLTTIKKKGKTKPSKIKIFFLMFRPSIIKFLLRYRKSQTKQEEAQEMNRILHECMDFLEETSNYILNPPS
ncbi:hypothetical protein QWY74_05325 [Halomonas almeriensis]|uniref:toxin-antitoxin system YwqK family antitoxin n=1 Tax=Halomonas almeriensis TaxID=308163 RepID=UPI0025B2A51F|nr:hypothetical protein [Halomonas almeriensis]MDN3552892.1 hypothetical protein [Halomonas almeriensis]